MAAKPGLSKNKKNDSFAKKVEDQLYKKFLSGVKQGSKAAGNAKALAPEKGVQGVWTDSFDMTLGQAIKLKGEDTWSGTKKTFALSNAKSIGIIAALIAISADHKKITKQDYISATNMVIKAAQERCPGAKPGEHCLNWTPLP
jgi:hypothetical protein